MNRFAGLLVGMWTAVLAGDAAQLPAADVAATVEQSLQCEIVSAATVLFEAQTFCDAGVPRMPETASAEQWETEAARLRGLVLDNIVYRGRASTWRDAATRVEWLETIAGGPGYHIRKLRFEALPGMWIPALLYEPDQLTGKTPAILNVNGHSAEGKAYVPKQTRCINQAKRGMLALNLEWYGMGQLRTPGFGHGSMNQLDLCGASGLAPFYLAMARGLDVLLSHPHADANRVAVTGLSGGGWQTIVISALDTRVKLAVPVAGYSSFLTRTQHLKDLGDSEQTPNDLATFVDYTHLTAMMAPRPTLLIYNAKDNCCFESGYALGPLLTAAHPIYCLYEAADALQSHVNYDPGTHNYEQDNRQALYRMLSDLFYDGKLPLGAAEIDSQGEIKTADQLNVVLPDPNEDFQTLALKLAAGLPRSPAWPGEGQAARDWQQRTRDRLRQLVRPQDYRVAADKTGSAGDAACTAEYWRLRMDNLWSVPATVLTPSQPQETVVLLADQGRAAAAAHVSRLVSRGARVVAIDPFCIGESYPGREDARSSKGALFAFTMAAVGQRPLGVQASQTAAAARWAAQQFPGRPVKLVAVGPRTGLAALIAAAFEPQAVQSLDLYQSLGSLREAIEQNWSARDYPELFCYGLLEAADIKQIAALALPRKVRFVEPSERARRELSDLKDYYSAWGVQYDPLSSE